MFSLATVCVIQVTASVCAAQSFRVPGDTGRIWIDSQLDLKPGTLVRLAAKGEVNVGAGWGSYGPEGTQKFADAPGYPAETTYHYGLVARLTQSRTNPDDDLREQWAYGEAQEYCAAAGGHLWLTVNDNEPKDNKGEFAVDVSLAACQLAPTGRERQSGTFRIALNGFAVNKQTQDSDLDGKADEVYFVADIFVTYRTGEIVEHRRLVSRVLGDPNAHPERQPAGTAPQNTFDLEGGGLVTGDWFPSRTPWRRTREPLPDRVPLLIWEGNLAAGDRIVTIVPTLWEWDGEDWFLREYDRELEFSTRDGSFFRGVAALARDWRGLDDGITFSTNVIAERSDSNDLTNIVPFISRAYVGDRPIGMWSTDQGHSGNIHYSIEHFMPWAMVFTYETASGVARVSTAYSNGRFSAQGNKGAGVIEYRLEDPRGNITNLGGAYTLYFQVERLAAH
jgi:hypothetical protein